MERITLNNEAPEQQATETPTTAPILQQGTVTAEEALKSAANADIPIISQETVNSATPLHTSSASVTAGNLIDGKIAIDLVDAVLPSLLVLLFHAVGMKMKKTDLQLTEKEKNTLSPLLQKCLDELMINFNNPWAALGISAGIIYGSKILEKGGIAFMDSKMKQEVVKTVQETKPAPKTNENRSPIEIVKNLTGNEEFSEAGIANFMKERKVGRIKAIGQMRKLSNAGKLEQKFK